VIDQVIGGAWATVLFSMTMGLLRGQEYGVIVDQVRNVRAPWNARPLSSNALVLNLR
jgi:hypothetical protein